MGNARSCLLTLSLLLFATAACQKSKAADNDTDGGSASDSDTDSDADSDTDSDSDSSSDTGMDSETHSDSDADTDTDADTYSESELDTDSGTAPGDGGIVDTDSGVQTNGEDAHACFLYIEAQCRQQAECGNRSVDEDCLERGQLCPWLYLADGSPWTVETLLSCKDAWADFPCDDVLRDLRPSCDEVGTRGGGKICKTSHQCQSLRCTGVSALGQEDGTCAALAEEGGACDYEIACPTGEHCSEDQCVPNKIPSPGTDGAPLSGLEEICRNSSRCEPGLYCEWTGSEEGIGVCRVPPSYPYVCGSAQGNGTPNTERPSKCNEADSYCGQDELCHPLPPAGEPCGLARYNGEMHCEHGAFCDPDEEICRPWLPLGEPCGRLIPGGTSAYILMPYCDVDSGAVCICSRYDGECTYEEAWCLMSRDPMETCTGPYDMCRYGSECVAGICDFL